MPGRAPGTLSQASWRGAREMLRRGSGPDRRGRGGSSRPAVATPSGVRNGQPGRSSTTSSQAAGGRAARTYRYLTDPPRKLTGPIVLFVIGSVGWSRAGASSCLIFWIAIAPRNAHPAWEIRRFLGEEDR